MFHDSHIDRRLRNVVRFLNLPALGLLGHIVRFGVILSRQRDTRSARAQQRIGVTGHDVGLLVAGMCVSKKQE
jgi:hypothetical protein